MNKQEKIDKIYEVIADKGTYTYIDVDKNKIKGMSVMIGDVLDWMYKNIEGEKEEFDKMVVLLASWDEYRKPIDEQSDECIEYIFNLITNI